MFEKIIPHTSTPERTATAEGNFYEPKKYRIGPGMNERVQKLRKLSFETDPSLSIERALHETAFYKENFGKYSVPVLRAMNFMDHCRKKTIYLGEGELIVGERGPKPKCIPTFPELTCHSVDDFHVLNTRDMQRYTISQEDIDLAEKMAAKESDPKRAAEMRKIAEVCRLVPAHAPRNFWEAIQM